MEITDERFDLLISEIMDELPQGHLKEVKNVAIVYADEPTAEQREKLRLRDGDSLFGLYEGVPLAKRNGWMPYMPDKITIFKQPLLAYAVNEADLRARVKHTLWHEIAHYFGLDHDQIHEIERRWK